MHLTDVLSLLATNAARSLSTCVLLSAPMHCRNLTFAIAFAASVLIGPNAIAEPNADAALIAGVAPAVLEDADALTMRALQHVRSAMTEQAVQVVDHTSALVSTAMGFIGVRYRRGGNNAETGFDCSGFVRAVYQKTAGLVLPRRAKDQAASATTIDKKDLQPGDLVFFNTMRRAFSHVGVYLGDGKFIHSPRTGEEVRVESLQASYWKTRFNGARRVALDDEASAKLAMASESATHR